MFWIFYILRLVQSACSYTNFDSFQLNSDSFYQEKSYVRGNPYAFGVWTQFAPIRKNFFADKSKPYFDSTLSLDGFHILNFQSGGNIQTLFYQQPLYVTGYPTLIILQYTQSGVFSYKIQEGLYYYEGYWVFTYFSFNYDNKYNFASYSTGDDRFFNFLVTNRRLKTQTTNAKLEYGGQGLYIIGTSSFNLNIFLGRISIITTFESSITFFLNTDKAKFLSFILSCLVPPACQSPVELSFFHETYNQRNYTARNYQVDIKGLTYMFDFWMKRDSYKVNSNKEILLSFGGIFQSLERFYQLAIYWRVVNQDVTLLHNLDVYYLQYENLTFEKVLIIIKIELELCQIVPKFVIVQPNTIFDYLIPGEQITQYNDDYLVQSQIKEIYLQLFKPKTSFEQWSYIKYQFQKVGAYQYVYCSLYQSCCDTWEQYYVLNFPYYQQYSNYQATITLFTEQNDVLILPFEGLISNLRFKYCYNIEYEFGKDSNINCNALCKTCTGPTKYDCASCYDEQNRYLLSDLHQCYCKSNYQEAGGLICQKTFLSSISQQKELYKEFNLIDVQNNNKCNYGYFEVWKDLKFLGCIKCPYFGQGHNSVNCINCILNSQNWYCLIKIQKIWLKLKNQYFLIQQYLNPICNIDYRTDDSKFYYNQQLDYQSQEIYIINIDLMITEQCHGCEYIAEIKNSQSIIIQLYSIYLYQECEWIKYLLSMQIVFISQEQQL